MKHEPKVGEVWRLGDSPVTWELVEKTCDGYWRARCSVGGCYFQGIGITVPAWRRVSPASEEAAPVAAPEPKTTPIEAAECWECEAKGDFPIRVTWTSGYRSPICDACYTKEELDISRRMDFRSVVKSQRESPPAGTLPTRYAFAFGRFDGRGGR